jgi:hypothetical protein
VRISLTIPFLALVLSALPGCPADTCTPADVTTMIVGYGEGAAFEAYTEGQVVVVQSAPQGGYGFPIKVRTTGLQAGSDTNVVITMQPFLEGEEKGSWDQATPLTCGDDGQGGFTPGALAVGFDQTEFELIDDFFDLEGQDIDLHVSIVDEGGNTATTVHTVTLSTGG